MDMVVDMEEDNKDSGTVEVNKDSEEATEEVTEEVTKDSEEVAMVVA